MGVPRTYTNTVARVRVARSRGSGAVMGPPVVGVTMAGAAALTWLKDLLFRLEMWRLLLGLAVIAVVNKLS